MLPDRLGQVDAELRTDPLRWAWWWATGVLVAGAAWVIWRGDWWCAGIALWAALLAGHQPWASRVHYLAGYTRGSRDARNGDRGP